MKRFEAFTKLIKTCSEPPKYEWNPKHVCLNPKNCDPFRFWSIWAPLMKPKECDCKGKFSIKCNSDYCASNQRACKEIKHSTKLNIKKC